MKIPKRFKLAGQTITVEYSDDMVFDSDTHGTANFRTSKIMLQKPTKGCPVPVAFAEQVFVHELVHYILFYANYREETCDEDLVNRLSLMLHQALTTMEY